jgi:hypothetical protein
VFDVLHAHWQMTALCLAGMAWSFALAYNTNRGVALTLLGHIEAIQWSWHQQDRILAVRYGNQLNEIYK